MPKTTKIDVLTVKLTVHIPHELGDALSLHRATDAIEGLCRYAADLGETAIDVRVNRVSAPEPAQEASKPEPAGDGLDTPDNLRRVPKRDESAAAE